MNRSLMALAAVVTSVVVTTVLVTGLSFAQTNETAATSTIMRWQHKGEMYSAIQSNNYDAWQSSMQEHINNLRQTADTLSSKVNQDTFAKLVEAHKLKQDGKIDEARQILEDLGLPLMPHGHLRFFHRPLK